jgi:hypothetical protein
MIAKIELEAVATPFPCIELVDFHACIAELLRVAARKIVASDFFVEEIHAQALLGLGEEMKPNT